ncbi:MAG TPA: ABC transporter permease [Longimicrobiales bacterium]|nr:ABC transporter permease [Longimicrobiales bacterium]
MDKLLHDVHFALRQLRRAPAFAVIVIATLAIGIGANTAIFSVVNALLLRPLPYPASEQLVSLAGEYRDRGNQWSVSYPNARDWRAQNRTLSEAAWYTGSGYSLVGGERPERIEGVRASWSLFPTLRTQPALGRAYTEAEDQPRVERVVVISHALWQRHFGGAADVLGKSITLSNSAYTVIGVMPQGFAFPRQGMDVYVPLRNDESTWPRFQGGLQVIGRMTPGTDAATVQHDMDRVSAALAAEYPAPNSELRAYVRTFRDALYGEELPTIVLTLLGAVGFVLLIACVNVANLLLARATGREREMAVRAAIGAGRGRVVRQLLTESVVLGIAGGALGLLLAVWGTGAIAAAIPEDAPWTREFTLDGSVLLFAVLLSVLTGLVFGLAPALHATRLDLNSLLVGRAGHQTRARGRRRSILVVAEVALALMLLVGAGLMIRSFTRLTGTDPGFRSERLITMRVGLDSRFDEATSHQFQREALEQLRALPGVEQAAAVDWIPIGGENNYNDFYIEGREPNENAGNVFATEGYLAAMSIPLLRGRDFAPSDTRGAPGVAIVNRTFAETFFPGEDVLGKRIRMGWDDDGYFRTIIGVAGDVRHRGLDEDARAEIFTPYMQIPWNIGGMTFVARTRGDPVALIEPLQQAIWRVNPEQVVYDVRTMQRVVDESSSVLMGRIMAVAFALFATVALTLAALGLYGVISYGVAQRTYEMGVRSALGAARGDVLRMVLGQGMRLVLLGLGLGLLGAFALTRVMESLLFGVSATDPVTFAAVATLLLAVSACASLVPALRAARVDPVIALRTE